MAYDNNNGGKYGKYFVQCSPGPGMDPEFKKIYDKFAHRILWMDGTVVPGALTTGGPCQPPARSR